MTLVEDRPTTQSTPPRSEGGRNVAGSSTAPWRLAARLARREVRRRPGRTLLVMLLVAVPVVAMTAASLVARSTIETGEDAFAREYGTADAVVFPISDSPDGGAFDLPTLIDLPDGTLTTSYVSTYTNVRALHAETTVSQYVHLTDVDLNDSITDEVVIVTAGRVPSEPGDVLLAPDVADALGVDVGDQLRLVRPDAELEVVGVGTDRADADDPLMIVAGFDRDLLRPSLTRFEALVDLPDDLSVDERSTALADLERSDQIVQRADDAFYSADASVSGRQLAWGWVAGVLGFVAVGIVIAAAFATSARRQLVTIGQLASNGAGPRIIRRTMGLQGMWTGLFGAAIGIPLGVAGAVALRGTTLLERAAGRPIEQLEVAPLDLVVVFVTAIVAATLAALVPARSAAKVPVLSALAGRRPVGQPPRWLAPLGVASFVTGLALLAVAASLDGGVDGYHRDLIAALAVAGGLAVVSGMVCASPLIVGAIDRVGSRRGGSTRLAARSLGRARARSAAVLTAIATVGTIAVIASTVVASSEAIDPDSDTGDNAVDLFYEAEFWGSSGDGYVIDGVSDPEPAIAPELPDAIRSDVEQVLPDGEWTPVWRVVGEPSPHRVEIGEEVARPAIDSSTPRVNAVVADDAVRSLVGFEEAQLAELEATGVLVVTPLLGDEVLIPTLDEPIAVDVSGSVALFELEGDRRAVTPFEGSAPGLELSEAFVTPRFVEEQGLTTTLSSYRIENPSDITNDQFNALLGVQFLVSDDSFVESATAPGFEIVGEGDAGAWLVNATYPTTATPWTLIRLAVAVSSLLLVLAVVAIGLSLSATESRDERDVLLAVGASPSTLRRVAATKAWLLTTGAALTAVPAGYITILVVMRAIGHNDVTAPFPFAIAALLVVVIPALAWVMTILVSSVAQRVRPVTASTMIVD